MITLPVCYCKTSRYCNWDFAFVYALLPFCSWLLQFKASVNVQCCLFLLHISFRLSGDMSKDNISWPAVIYICIETNELAVILLSRLKQTIIKSSCLAAISLL